MELPIIFAIDDRCAPMLHVTIASICAQMNSVDDYHLFVLYENLSPANQASLLTLARPRCQIEFVAIGTQLQKYAAILHHRYFASNIIYARVFIPELLPQYSRVLYLDADVVLNADVAELFQFDLQDNYVGAVICSLMEAPFRADYARRYLGLHGKFCYFNNGVMLMNCTKLRREHFLEKFLYLVAHCRLEICPDQDYYNLLCYGKTLLLPRAWNVMPIAGTEQPLSQVKLVHFNLIGKPWLQTPVLYENLFWQYAQQTPVYQQLLQIRAQNLPQSDALAAQVQQISDLVQALGAQNINWLARLPF